MSLYAMTTLGEWTKLIVAVTGALSVMAGLVAVIVKRYPPRSASLAVEVANLKSDMRLLTDYVHDLREDCARGGITPRDWPEGLRM